MDRYPSSRAPRRGVKHRPHKHRYRCRHSTTCWDPSCTRPRSTDQLCGTCEFRRMKQILLEGEGLEDTRG